jgi:hypothetical protein
MTAAELVAKADSEFNALTAVDVVGLQSETHGRSCNDHMCCGHHVGVNDKLVCIWQVQQIDERPNAPLEEVIQVHKIGRDGLVTCHVGYLPKRLFCKHGSHRFDLMYLKVKHDLRCSDNSHERQRSHRNHGVVLCDIIKDNVKYNSHNPFQGDPCDVSVHEEVKETIKENDDAVSDAQSVAIPSVVRTRCNTKKANKSNPKYANEDLTYFSSDSSEAIAQVVKRLKKKLDDDEAGSLSSHSSENIAAAVQRLKKQKKKQSSSK